MAIITRTVFYTTEGAKKVLIDSARDLGESVIHDDFGVGPEGQNQLSFGTTVESFRDPNRARINILVSKIADETIVYRELVELLKLERDL